MQAASERRTLEDDRVPLDALIQLTSEDGGEVLEADAVDLSAGGLSLKASFMPPVGVRMQCRFACPPFGDAVVADCEVIWSAWEGPQAGAFGVRFLALDTRSATLIRRLVDPEADAASSLVSNDAVELETAPAPLMAQLHIDGLGAPIETDVRLDQDDHVVLEQELGFLGLGRGVSVEMDGVQPRRGRIASVELKRSGNDVPALSVGVLLDGASPGVFEPSEAMGGPAVVTQLDAPQALYDAPLDRSELRHEEPELEEEALDASAFETHFDVAARDAGDTWPETPSFEGIEQPAIEISGQEQAVQALQTVEHADVPQGDEDAVDFGTDFAEVHAPAPPVRPAFDDAPPAERADRNTAGDEDAGSDVPVLVSRLPRVAVDAVQGVWDKTRPALNSALARARETYVERSPGIRTRLLELWAIALGWLKANTGALARLKTSTSKKRRTTAPASRASHVEGREGRRTRGAKADEQRGRGRSMLAGALAFVGVGAAIYSFAPRQADEPLALHRSVQAPVVVPASPAPSGLPSAAPPAPAVAPPAAGGSEVVVPAAELAPTAAVVEAAPSAPNDPRHFGVGEVPNGRTYTLRMSGPVDSIEGEVRRGGFMVRIPGRLSLDRASPIATSHPALSRSLILNQGDRAELTIEFMRGKEPRYSVAAKGSTIEVTVERI